MKRRALRPGEKALWERVARTVEPLRGTTSPAALEAGESPPAPPPTEAQPPARQPEAGSPPRSGPRPPGDVDRTLRKKLARGTAQIDARLDLHGMTQEEAHGALTRFILESHAAGRRLVLVITGKGRGGGGEGILRRAVPHWLAQRELARIVVSIGRAGRAHGGDGALYVQLRSVARARTARR